MNNLNTTEIKSPLKGVLLDLSQVPDPVFAQKMVGDGLAIDPLSDTLLAPIAGEVIQLHSSNHAITIKSTNGLELLLHVGIDTVKLKGKGFKPLVKVGDQVSIGTPLLKLDLDYLAIHAKSLITPIIITSEDNTPQFYSHLSNTIISPENSIFSCTINNNINGAALENTQGEEVSEEIIVTNPLGIHARPSSHIVSIAKSYSCQILIKKGNKEAKAKSLVSLISLEANHNDKLTVVARGKDAKLAVQEITHFINNHREDISENNKTKTSTTSPSNLEAGKYFGHCASEGLALGKLLILSDENLKLPTDFSSNAEEIQNLTNAVSTAKEDLQELITQLEGKVGKDKAKIFKAHQDLLEDPEIYELSLENINQGLNAPLAWSSAYQKAAKILSKLDDVNLRERAQDIKDIGKRVLYILVPNLKEQNPFNNLGIDTILVAEDLTPSETAKLDHTKVKGIITSLGGTTSHVAIIARSLGIPTIVGAGEDILSLNNKEIAIINAEEGFLKINPSEDEIKEAKDKIETIAKEFQESIRSAQLPAITQDNITIEVAANVTSVADVKNAVELGCDGVGLLRTEFLYMEREIAPSIEEQVNTYEEMTKLLNAGKTRPIVIRTLDIGGDKPLSYIPIPEEENPFLGERGIRVSLSKPQIFEDQLRAILKSAHQETIHIMFPMISELEELLEAKKIVKKIQEELQIPTVKLGIMIEVPSAALMAETLAPYVDFFSIGANDLTQYTIAVDRGHPKLARKADGLNPAVLKLIEITCKAAEKNNIWVGVCGGIASDLAAVPILLGLGVRELSVSIPMIPKVKTLTRTLNIEECKSFANLAMTKASANEVRSLKYPRG